MYKLYHQHENSTYDKVIYVGKRRKYGIFNFLFDCIMVGLTCGLWLIWIFAREMRSR